ncbi:MAG: ATP synthase F1 subunit epsilon [Planctomycetia bacterium]|nr:ATP synthase F1 subunit epsilon [Planctomycetia bacterium]
MELKCVVVTPEKTVLDQAAESITLPLYDGEYGIEWNHTPLIGRLGAGLLRLRKGDRVDAYYVSGGFVEVLANTVSLMTARAIPAAEITLAKADAAMVEAKAKPGKSVQEMEIRDQAMREARAMLRIANRKHSS